MKRNESYFCEQLGHKVILELTVAHDPGDAQREVVTRLSCQDVCIECGVKQDIDPATPMYNWAKCAAHNKFADSTR